MRNVPTTFLEINLLTPKHWFVSILYLEEPHGHGDSIEGNVPPGWSLSSPGDDLQQRPLARALGAEDSVQLATMDLEGDVFKDDSSPDTPYQLLKTGAGFNLSLGNNYIKQDESMDIYRL